MKKIILSTIVAASLLAFALPAVAAAPNWDITGAWDLHFNATVGAIGTYDHHMDVTQALDGSLTGTGYYIPASSYTWVIDSGSYVSGDSVHVLLHYTGGHPDTWTTVADATIDSSGNLSGTWLDNQGNSGPVTSYDGTATVIVSPPPIVGPPTNKDQCKKDGWKTFNNPSFKNQGQCEKYVNEHREGGKARGDITISSPSQKIKFEVNDKNDSKPDKGKVEYWNYDYSGGVLHYKADALCVDVDQATNEARFMFQIPAGWPGLSGLYVVADVQDNGKHGTGDTYAHTATGDLTTAISWCKNGGAPFSSYPVTGGDIKIEK